MSVKHNFQEKDKNAQYLECFNILKQIQQIKPDKFSQKIVDTSLILQLQNMSHKIQQTKKQQLHEQTNRYQNYLLSPQSQSPAKDGNQLNITSKALQKLSYKRVLKEVFGIMCLQECIFPYFEFEELIQLRLVCKSFQDAFSQYFTQLLPQLEQTLIRYIFRNPDLDLSELKKAAYLQIPREIRPWVILDSRQCQNVIENTLYRQDIDSLKQIKKVPKQFDASFAPFCILLGYSQPIQFQKGDGKLETSWHSLFLKITSTTNNILKFMSLDFSKITQNQIDEIINYLNQFSFQQLENFNSAALKLFIWTRALVSLYHIDNIFKIRKPNELIGKIDNKIIESMFIIQKEKGIINKLRRIMKNDKMFKIYLDFNQIEKPKTVQDKSIPFFSLDNAQLIQQFLNYLTLKDILKLRSTNTFIKELCHVYILSCLSEQITSLERKKMLHINQIYPVLPSLYENCFFSDFFDVSSEILMKKLFLVDRHSFSRFKCQTKPSHSLEKFCKIISIIFNIQPQQNSLHSTNQTKQNTTLLQSMNQTLNQINQRDQYFQYIKNSINAKNFEQQLKQFNPFHINPEKIKECEEIAFSLESDLMKDPNQIGIIEDLQGLRLYINLLIIFYRATMPLDYCNSNIFQENLLDVYSDIYSVTDSCQRLFKICYHFSLLTPENMKIIVSQAYESLQNDHQYLVTQLKKKEFSQLKHLYQKARDSKELNGDKVQLIIIELIERYNTQQRSNEVTQKIKQAKEKQEKTQNFLNYFKHFFLKNILNFLSLQDLVVFGLVNKNAFSIYNIYLHFRIHIEASQIKSLELQFENQIKSIDRKKRIYFQDSETDYPKKEHAIQLLTEISLKDVSNLKRITKSCTGFDLFAKPVVELLNIKLEYKTVYLKKQPDYWTSLFKFMQVNDFNKILQEFQVEIVETAKIKKIERYIKENQNFTIQSAFKLSESLSKLVKWIFGVLEIHKFLRRYSLCEEQEEMMDAQELKIANYLDFRQKQSYKMLRYIGKHSECQKEYEYWSQIFLKESNKQKRQKEIQIIDESTQQNNQIKRVNTNQHLKKSKIEEEDEEEDSSSFQNQNYNYLNQSEQIINSKQPVQDYKMNKSAI
ncbi:hypothetical protein ABPG74_009466 [Tetrahymena malaccensis]